MKLDDRAVASLKLSNSKADAIFFDDKPGRLFEVALSRAC
jgi:hypothetical protein